MKLSIIIVNFNVAFYLEQCLNSVEKAVQNIDCELFVVDNNSVDGSCQMVRRLFPQVKLLGNATNVGFSKANNQAIKLATGEYILLLNPDTVVENDSFKLIIEYLDSHPESGGLGVKMIDGNGKYLPESKRGFPSPMVAFYKLSGFARIFPKSKQFNKYHLGYLDKDEIHEVDVLSGAFMMLRKLVIDKIGLLDETYFMYGEDIDLSYRIIKEGFKNIYFPKTTIIHYKGKSTQKGSLNYVILFYTAMKIFSQKFFSKSHARTFVIFINIAIYFRAFISLCRRIFTKLLYPIIDFIILYSGFALFSAQWGQYRYQNPNYDFPDFYYDVNIPIYGLILILSLYISGTYIRPIEIKKTIKWIAIAMLLNLILFALLPEKLRFSRAMFLVGTIWVFIFIPLSRFIFHFIDKQNFTIKSRNKRRTIIIGNEEECNRVNELIKEANKSEITIGFVSPVITENPHFLCNLSLLNTIIKIHKIDDVIFCEQDIPEKTIINEMIQITSKNIEFKIAPHRSRFIIGNSLTNSNPELYKIALNSIALKRNKIIKRAFDIALSIALILFSPILLFYFGKGIKNLLLNSVRIIKGTRTWVGYNYFITENQIDLPKMKQGIISIVQNKELDILQIQKTNLIYAKDYSILKDLYLVFSNFKHLCS